MSLSAPIDETLSMIEARHDLDGSDRDRLRRFASLIDSAYYTPIPDEQMAARRADVRAGQQMNAIENNHGTPLARAKLDLLLDRRVPAKVGARLLATEIRNHARLR